MDASGSGPRRDAWPVNIPEDPGSSVQPPSPAAAARLRGALKSMSRVFPANHSKTMDELVPEKPHPTLHHTQGKILVTEQGRLKMVHDDTRRSKEWMSVPLTEPDYSGTTPIELECFKLEDLCDFRINVLNDGAARFELRPGTLFIASVTPELSATSPIDVGDRVMKVDDETVETFDDYLSLTEGVQAYTLTIRPKEDFEVRPRTADEKEAERVSRLEFNMTSVAGLEDTGVVSVPLRRLGDTSQRLVWPWRAKNGNVNPRIFAEFEAQHLSGEVVFEPGKDDATIDLKVPSDPSWNVESLYFAFLEPEHECEEYRMQNGVRVLLGGNRSMNIYSLNQNSFPDGAFGMLGDVSDPHKYHAIQAEVPWHVLAWKFMVHNYHEFPWETRWAVLYALLPALFYYWTQLNFGILVNCAIADREKAQCVMAGVDFTPIVFNDSFNSALVALLFVVVWRLFILLCEHLVATRMMGLRLGGKATRTLRANMYTTLLQMADGATVNFDVGDIQKILDTEVENSVQNVWLLGFALLKQVGSLVVKLILSIQIVVELEAVRPKIVLIFCIPLIAGVSLLVFTLRKRKLLELHDEAFMCDENWSAFVTLSTEATTLIRSYQRAWYFTECFKNIHKRYNKAAWTAANFAKHTIWILKYLFFVVSATVIIMGGTEVRSGALKVGDFLVLLRVIDGFGGDVLHSTKISNKMLFGSAAVRKVAEVLNSETWRHELRKRRELKVELSQKTSDAEIRLQGVQFSYPDMQAGQTNALVPMNLTLPAGEMICFPGRSSFASAEEGDMPGMNTLFSIIAGRLQPKRGEVLLPARWRVIHVPVAPILFDGTLMYNLLFSDRAANPDLAWEICRGLGMSPGLIGKADFDVGTNGHFLKFSDRVIVSIARALLHDVDVLLISSALDVLGQGPAVKVLRYLRNYSEKRGFCHEGMPKSLRHMKTIMYTSKFKLLQEQAMFLVHPAPRLQKEGSALSLGMGPARSLRLSASSRPTSPENRPRQPVV